MMTDPIADLLTRIRNAQARGHKAVSIRCSKGAERILNVLKNEGFVAGYEKRIDPEDQFGRFEVFLRYAPNGRPGIKSSKRVSKPGRRVYVKAEKLPTVHCGLGIAIISTSQGVFSDREARRLKIGGELLAYVS